MTAGQPRSSLRKTDAGCSGRPTAQALCEEGLSARTRAWCEGRGSHAGVPPCGRGHGAGRVEMCGNGDDLRGAWWTEHRPPRSAGQAVLRQVSAAPGCAQAPPLCDFVRPCWAGWCTLAPSTHPQAVWFRPPVGANQPGERGQETSPCLSFPIFKVGVLSPALA